MKVYTKEFFIPKKSLNLNGLDSIENYYNLKIKPSFPLDFPIRFIISKTDEKGYYCEIDFISVEKKEERCFLNSQNTIFNHRVRSFEKSDKFTAVLMIPTGIGAELGGHCGDGNVAARLIASACDTLIVHPNVVNASDINEMTENTLYVEGSILTRFMMGTIGLQRVRFNKILMLMDKNEDRYFNDEIINAVSSARVTLGIDCDVLQIDNATDSKSHYSSSGRTSGEIKNIDQLFKLIEKHKNNYDALGLSTIIKVPESFNKEYFKSEKIGVNPWGGTEAMLTHSVAENFRMPSAHSPMSYDMKEFHIDMDLGIVDPRKAPETASVTYLHCILKGLHKSPRIVDFDKGLNVESVSCLIIPDGCVGLPILACLDHGIPVIAVKNKNIMQNKLLSLPFGSNKLFIVDNYLEAVGIMNALKSGVNPESLMRPIKETKLL
jgi:hypothetical protein